jgi:carbonic anhydrase
MHIKRTNDIKELLAGNTKFACGADQKELKGLAQKGQSPLATVVSCSDSRVPVEVLFNQLSPGRLFVIRIAGNIVADPSVKGSIEYGVGHLKTPYLIVIGHSECGAIKAYLDGVKHGNMGRLLGKISLNNKELDKAIKENIELQVKRVLEIEEVQKALATKSIEIYGMFYDLETGTLTCLSKNGFPYQD